MNKTRSLYKAFGSNLEMPKPDSDTKKKIYSRFGMIAFIGIMIPVSIIAGYVTYAVTDMLYQFGGSTYALLSELDLLSAFALIFGLPLMFSVLYFASDLKFLTALPITATSLFNARFMHTFKAENVMTSNTLFAIFIGFFVAAIKHIGISALHPVALIASVVAFFACLLVPLIYCSILGMLVMLLMKFFKNEKVYYHISTVLFILFSGVFIVSLRDYGKISAESYLESLIGKDNRFTYLCNILFPSNALSIKAIETHEIIPLLLSVMIPVALYFLTLLIAKLTYRNGLFTAATLGGKKASRKARSNDMTMRKRSDALLKKEFRVLLRTMTYRMNCIYVNLIWVIAAPVVGMLARNNGLLRNFAGGLKNGDAFSHTIMMITMVSIAFIASGLNSIASTSFTREGVHIDLIKYLPADISLQIRAKAQVSIIITFVPLMIALVTLSIMMEDPMIAILYIPITLMGNMIACFTGMTMDSIAPYTIWSDELSALRGNLNCFFNLASELIVALVLGAISFGLYKLTGNYIAVITVNAVVLVIATLWGIFKGTKVIRKNIESLT